MVFKTVILSVRELKSKNSNCLSGHSPQPREPGLPDCLQRLLSHCVLFKVRKHTHTQTMWHHSAQMCVRAWWRFTCSTLTQICQRTVGNGCVCASACACQSGPLHLIMCIIMGVLSSSFLVVTSCQSYHWTLTFDLGPPEVGQSIIFCENLVLSPPPSRRCHMVYTHYRGCIWICLPLPTKFYNYGNVFRLPDFIPLFFYWFLHFLFFFFFQ